MSSDQIRGQWDLGGLGMWSQGQQGGSVCVFVEKKQQNRSYAAGTRVSGASAPRSPASLAVSPLQCCLGLGQFPGSVQPPPCPEQGRVLV